VLAIHPEPVQRIRTTAPENGARLEGIQRTVGQADPMTTQLYDRRRFMIISLQKPEAEERTMFFELRQYRTKPEQREKWVKFMEEEIIPLPIRKGY
jgi:hypothetical protein